MISSELTHENVSGLLVISDWHNANKLKQVCCEYIRQHYSQVIETSQYREIRSEVENILNNNDNVKNNSTWNNNAITNNSPWELSIQKRIFVVLYLANKLN
jgi:hypothetical protein